MGLSIQASVYPSEVWELRLKFKVESCIHPKKTGMELKRGGLMGWFSGATYIFVAVYYMSKVLSCT